MARNGIPPLPDEERSRRNQPLYSSTPVKWDGKIRGPALRASYPWCEETLEWYEMFRRTPQSMICTKTDWSFIQDTALLYDRMWRDRGLDSNGNQIYISETHLTTLSAEFRRRMSMYGYTWEDRQKQRMEIESPLTEENKKIAVEQAAAEVVDYATMLNEEVAKRQE